MKTILRITFLSLLFVGLSCSKDDNEVQTPEVEKSDAKVLTSFVFNAGDNATLSETISGTVNEANKNITIAIPTGTDISALKPTIQVSPKANVSPIGAQDFNDFDAYTVTAEDGSTVQYTVSIFILVAQNNAPLSFDLIAVTDNAVAVDVLPTFSWNAATDPDGDDVTYDLYLDFPESANDGLYAENLSETTFEVTERLGLLQDYIWKVVAKDSKGASTSSATRSFGTRALRFNDTPVTANPDFSRRFNHASIVFDNKMWVIGGRQDSDIKKDVWFSSNGITWQEATNEAPFGARYGHSSVVFDNKMWVIGGFHDNERKNDVWFSSDGVTWQEATNDAPFGARLGHSSVVFDNKIWVIGGDGGGIPKNDVWFSSDGVTWSVATNEGPFAGRRSYTSIVFDNKIWIIGGDGGGIRKNDVWFSSDGVTWIETTRNAAFTERQSHTTVVFDNKIWVIGGASRTSTLNDLWYSEDGVVWEEVDNFVNFPPILAHSSLVFDNKLWVISGLGLRSSNNIWTFE